MTTVVKWWHLLRDHSTHVAYRLLHSYNPSCLLEPPLPPPTAPPPFPTPVPFFHEALSLGNFFSHDSYFQAMLVVGFECIIQCRTDCLSALETLLFNQVNGRQQNLFFFSLLSFFFSFFFFSFLFSFSAPSRPRGVAIKSSTITRKRCEFQGILTDSNTL